MHYAKRLLIDGLVFISLVAFADYFYFNVLSNNIPPLQYLAFALLMALVAIIFPLDSHLKRMK